MYDAFNWTPESLIYVSGFLEKKEKMRKLISALVVSWIRQVVSPVLDEWIPEIFYSLRRPYDNMRARSINS
jgi:hypothetical protein